MTRSVRRWRSCALVHRARQKQTAAVASEPTFTFKCTQCGQCCTGKGGRVRVNQREIDELQRVVGTSLEELQKRYLAPASDADAPGTWLIKQTPDDAQCIFLEGRRCSVYEARPTQCRTFPWWPQNLISSYDWQLAARYCEGIRVADMDREGVSSRSLRDVLPEAVVYDIHRSGEEYTYEELHAMLRDLQDVDPTFLDEYARELREKFHRTVVFQDASVTILDTFLDGASPSRCFVFNDRLHLVQSEMVLLPDSDQVDPSKLVLDVHQAMCVALPWLSTKKSTDWKVAVLGSGGGSLVRYILHEKQGRVVAFDAVEPNATVNEVARRFFGLPIEEASHDLALQLHQEFGEEFVARQLASGAIYDLFMVDVEGGESSDGVLAPPSSMLSVEFLSGVYELLSDNGVVAINVITEDGGALARVSSVLHAVFTHGVIVTLPKNSVFFLSKLPIDTVDLEPLVTIEGSEVRLLGGSEGQN